MKKLIDQVKKEYSKNQKLVNERIDEFNSLKTASDERLFQELVFIILSSQSNAKQSWKAAKKLESNGMLSNGSKNSIAQTLDIFEIQQANRKAEFILKNRRKLSQPTLTNPSNDLKLKDKINTSNLERSRKWFSENIDGISWKGSSHFLRNTGYADNFAIISKPVLQILYEYNIVKDVEPPKNFKEYREIEKLLLDVSEKSQLSLAELDLLLWSMKTGEVFK